MQERSFDKIRLLPREDLEYFALRAAMQIHDNRKGSESGRLFFALMIGLVLGALIASAGFVAGSSLG